MSATRTRCLLSVQPTADGGGSETALLRMVRQLSDEGWTCHVAVPSTPRLAEEYAAAGAIVHVVGMRRITTSANPGYWLRYALAWPASVLALARLARRCHADVVHSNSLHCWYGWAAAALVRRPHVWHAREIVTQSAIALRVERALARRFAVRVIAASAAVAAQLDPANVEVATDEPDPATWSPTLAGRFRGPAGLGDDTPLVGSVARIDTWKGFDALLDAVPLVRVAIPDAEFVVAGGRVEGKETYAAHLAARAGAIGGVHWLGHRRDVPELIADLDVFVQVSTTPEPWGLVVAEALASGVPVVAGNEGGPVEILAGAVEGAGLLVPAGDAGALASAIISLLALAPRNADGRRRRPRLRAGGSGGGSGAAGRFGDIFASAMTSGRAGRRAGWFTRRC